MRYAVNHDGVKGLRGLAKQLQDFATQLNQKSLSLEADAQSYQDGLGVFTGDVMNMVENIIDNSQNAQRLILQLSEKLENKAQRIEQILASMAVSSPIEKAARTALGTGIIASGIILNGMFPQLSGLPEEVADEIIPPTPLSTATHQVWEMASQYYEDLDKKEELSEVAQSAEYAERIKIVDSPED